MCYKIGNTYFNIIKYVDDAVLIALIANNEGNFQKLLHKFNIEGIIVKQMMNFHCISSIITNSKYLHKEVQAQTQISAGIS